MNRIILGWIILSITVLYGCNTTSRNTTSRSIISEYMTLKTYSLRGNVKTATQMHYDAHKSDDGVWQKKSLIVGGANNHEKRYFDVKGRHLKQEFLTSEREVRAIYATEWDKEGNFVICDRYFRDDEEIYIGKHNYPHSDSLIINTFMGGSDYPSLRFESKIEQGREVNCKHTLLDEEGNITGTTYISSKFNRHGESEFKFTADGDRKSYHFKYDYLEFDKFKNWTKALKKDILTGKNIIIERELEYYQ